MLVEKFNYLNNKEVSLTGLVKTHRYHHERTNWLMFQEVVSTKRPRSCIPHLYNASAKIQPYYNYMTIKTWIQSTIKFYQGVAIKFWCKTLWREKNMIVIIFVLYLILATQLELLHTVCALSVKGVITVH